MTNDNETFELFECDDESGAATAATTETDTETETPAPYRLTAPERDRIVRDLAARQRVRVMWLGWREKVRQNPRRLFALAHHATRQTIAASTFGADYRATFVVACGLLTGRIELDVRALPSTQVLYGGYN